MINYNLLLAFNLFGMILGALLAVLVIIADQNESESGYKRDSEPLPAPIVLRGNSGVDLTYERAS